KPEPLFAGSDHAHEDERAAREEREEPARAERSDEHVTDVRARTQDASVVGKQDRRSRRTRVARPDRFRKPGQDAGKRDRAVGGNEDEIGLPAQPYVQMTTND